MHVPVSSVTAASVALLLLFLGLRVSLLRMRLRVRLGDGGDKALSRAIRAHGNLAEHGVLVVVLLFLYELQGGSQQMASVVAAAFLIARLIRVVPILARRLLVHQSSAVVTYAVELALPLLLLAQWLQS